MNGYEATRQIRALNDPELAGITILAMTANAFDEDKKKALECGIAVITIFSCVFLFGINSFSICLSINFIVKYNL
jgi:CheY-like chemotaxis protein